MQTTALKPYHVAVSRPARRAYLTTLLAVSTGVLLFGLAVTAYVLFYWSYIPRIGFERVVHLQFEEVYNTINNPPHGTIQLAPDVVSGQRYEVVVELVVPRTPGNLDAGNFMVQATMHAPEEATGSSIMETVAAGSAPGSRNRKALATSRRPAHLSYRSPVIELVRRFTQLHWYILGLREETDKLRVSLFESVEFARGWRNLPATMDVEIQSHHRLQIYSATATFRARFRGLRWLMYNHRVLSAISCITVFWMTEMLFAGIVWAVLALFVLPPGDGEVKSEKTGEASAQIKDEPEGDQKAVLSDTERTFPTLSTQAPLRYENSTSSGIKQEIKEEEDHARIPEAVGKAAEADDEDEDADTFLDSGLGTSMESSGAGRRDSMRRRRGRLTPGEER